MVNKKSTNKKEVRKKEVRKKAGRPKKELTDKQIAEIPLLARGMTIKEIAEYFDLSESAFNKLKCKNININIAYKSYRAKCVNKVVNRLFDIIEGNTSHTFPAIAFYLKTQAGWREKQTIDIDTTDLSDKLTVHFSNAVKQIEK